MVGEVGIGSVLLYLIVGAIAIFCGITVIRFRKKINDYISTEQSRVVGRSGARALSRLQGPLWYAVVGVIAVIIGMAMMTLGVISMFA